MPVFFEKLDRRLRLTVFSSRSPEEIPRPDVAGVGPQHGISNDACLRSLLPSSKQTAQQ
jgi:hypothetical protein